MGLAVCLFAVSRPADAAVAIHHSLHIEDGLVQSQVNTIYEDRRGFVWFGTFGGVSRWDGTHFRNYQIQDGLGGLDIRGIHETADGALLFATSDNGVSILRDGVFTILDEDSGLPGSSTRALHLGADGTFSVATGDGLFIFADESLDPTTARHVLPGLKVSGFSSRRAGGVYLSTFGDRVQIYENGTATPLDPDGVLPGDIIRDVHETRDGTLYISVYRNGVWVWRDGVFEPFAHNAALASHDVKAFTETRGGDLYMATLDGGVAVLRGDAFEIMTTADGLADNTLWAIHEGRSGKIYFGTWGGVSLYDPGRFATWDTSCGLQSDIVTTIAERGDGTFAVGTIGGGVALLDGNRVTRTLGREDGLENDRVWSLLSAMDGSLYIGTHTGLNRLRAGRLTTVYHESEDPSGRVYAMHQSPDDTIYLATYGGILVLKGGVVEPLYKEEDPERSSVFSACATQNGDLYFGTGVGIVIMRDGGIDIPDSIPLLSTANVWSIHEGRDGTLYFGTDGGGLLIARDGLAPNTTLEVFDVTDGLSDNTVFGITEDADGRLYLTTRRGVTVVNFGVDPPHVRQIHSADGLASEECNQGAAFADSRGRMWVGTIRGVTCYDPGRDLPVVAPPMVHLLRARLFEDDLPLTTFDGGGSFDYRENFFKFDFIATNPASPGDVRYRFRMSGVDPDWVEDRRTMIQYTALPPDDYTFSVAAGNAWGAWSEPVELRFRVTPPFWSTWWFRILVVLTIIAVVTTVVRYRIRQMLALERLRTRIAADLHDDIGSGLTEVSITANVLEHKLSPDQRGLVRGELDRLGESSRRLVQGMSDIVWLVQPKLDSVYDLIARLGDAYRDMFAAKEIEFEVSNLESLRAVRLDIERRQHLYLIFKEAINNSLKYSRCSRLSMSAREVGVGFELRLEDNGVGFDIADSAGGNGLGNMRRRAGVLGGELKIDSTVGKGTSVIYTGR